MRVFNTSESCAEREEAAGKPARIRFTGINLIRRRIQRIAKGVMRRRRMPKSRPRISHQRARQQQLRQGRMRR